MTLLKSLLFVLAIGLISSCASKKGNDITTSEESKIESNMNSKKLMLEEGYSDGIIIASRTEGDCPFVIDINDENYSYFLDPVNLAEDFKTDGQKIWFKFTASRMPNRCEKANPVWIVDIKKRVE